MNKREKRPKSKVRKVLEWVGFGIIAAVFTFAMAAQIDAMVHKNENWGQQLRFGVGNFVVETDSMEPDYKVGSAIITYRKSADEIYAQWAADPSKPIDITFSYQHFASFAPDDPTLSDQTNRYGSSPLYGHAMTHRLREIHVDNSVPVGKGHYIFIVAGINTGSVEWKTNQYQAFTENYMLGVVVLNSDALGKVFQFISSGWGLFGLLLIPAFYLVISSTIDIFRTLRESESGEAEAAAGSKSGKTLENASDEERERLKQELLMQMLDERRKAKQEAAKKEEAGEEKPADSPEKPAEEAPKEAKKEVLSGYDDEQKAALRKQMLAQIMAERAQGKAPAKEAKKDKSKKEEPKEEKPEEPKKKEALAGYSEEDKKRLRQQMLAQIMAEKKAAKEKQQAETKKEDDSDGQA